MDWLLRVITAKLDPIEEPSRHNFDAIYKTILPNEMTPDAMMPRLRKIRLQFQAPFMIQVLQQDLRPSFRELFGQIFTQLDWATDDLEERVGYGAASNLAILLGWKAPPLT